MKSHAALPSPWYLGGDEYRVYFSGRDAHGRSQIGFFDLAFRPKPEVLRVSERPVVSPGPLGAFDDNGVTSSCVISAGDALYQYYSGWSLGKTVPFYLAIGLALSSDSGTTFEKASVGPMMDRDRTDPYLTASPSILIEAGLWRMWYISGVAWDALDTGMRHLYLVKYADSPDGVNWHREGSICIDFATPGEYAMGRPCVIRDGSTYQMWFCARGDRYQAAFAESADGLNWRRKDDEAGLSPSSQGWDSEMIAYPYVFDHKGERYMLYNGNGYGKTGIGLARLLG